MRVNQAVHGGIEGTVCAGGSDCAEFEGSSVPISAELSYQCAHAL